MEKWKKRAVDLMTSLAFGGKSDLAVVSYYPQKTKINASEEQFFARSTPERKGISSKRIYNMLCELEGERRANIHTLMVICGGEVISECSADGYSTNSWHISHSMAKTVCGMIIGTLIDEGVLKTSDLLIDVFPEIEYRDKRFAQITVEHLLTMTSGVDFAEAGAVTDSEWTKTFFSSTVKFAPGTKFAYNSMNTYILARVAERVSGKSFGELADRRIFAPLGIKNYLWEKGPEGIEKGGWGLYLSAESWAKLGYMMLCGGKFRGRRILSKEWVKKSSTVKAIAPDFNGNFNYGYQMWTARSGDEFLFNGMLGQNVWICPKNDIIVVMLGGNNEMFQASPALEIVRKHLGGNISDTLDRRDFAMLQKKQATFFDVRRWVRPRKKSRGLLYWLRIRSGETFDEAWNTALGRYVFGINNAEMFPLIVRVMQNNLRSSLEEIVLRREGEGLYLDYKECGESYSIRVGLYGYEENVLVVRGEPYVVKSMGEAVTCQNGEVEYRIEILPSETASVRRLTIKREHDKIIIKLEESPNNRVVENLLSHYSKTNSALAFGVDVIERRLGEGAITGLLEKAFSLTLVGADASRKGYKKIIEKENGRVAEENQKVKVIRAIVDRFFKENTIQQEEKKTPLLDKNVKKSLSDIMDKISRKTSKNSKNDN